MYVLEGVFLLLIVCTTIYNFIKNDSFLVASVSQLLTLLLTLGIAFWATQFQNDRRKMKEHAESIIVKLQQLVTDESFYSFIADGDEESIKKRTTLTNRRISNYIDIIKQYGKDLGFADDVEYIENQFTDYKTIVSENIEDLSYLNKSETQFRRFSENIDSKCDKIILSLYK